jgi:hypothetical protein
MAKITEMAVENPSTAEFYTLTSLQKGDKIAFLPLDWGGVIANTDDNNKKYLQVLPIVVLSTTGATFISRISANTFTARAVTGVAYPQLQHAISKKIAYCGLSAIEELAKGCKFVAVGESYDIKCAYRKQEGTYNWTTLGLDATDETYTLDANGLTIGDEVFTMSDIQARLKEYAEKQQKRLNLSEQTE